MFELVCLGTDAARQETQADVFGDATCVSSMSIDRNSLTGRPESQHWNKINMTKGWIKHIKVRWLLFIYIDLVCLCAAATQLHTHTRFAVFRLNSPKRQHFCVMLCYINKHASTCSFGKALHSDEKIFMCAEDALRSSSCDHGLEAVMAAPQNETCAGRMWFPLHLNLTTEQQASYSDWIQWVCVESKQTTVCTSSAGNDKA